MLGIPAASSPASRPAARHPDDGTFQVRDLDAHSWVEVYFRGHRLGDVRPDPGRRAGRVAAPARRASPGSRGPAPDPPALDQTNANGRTRTEAAAAQVASSSGGGSVWTWIGLAAAIAASRRIAAAVAFVRRRRAGSRAGSMADAQVSELARRPRPGSAGSSTPTRPCSGSSAGSPRLAAPRCAATLAMLRAHRYAATPAPPPGPAERRALRSAISSGSLAPARYAACSRSLRAAPGFIGAVSSGGVLARGESPRVSGGGRRRTPGLASPTRSPAARPTGSGAWGASCWSSTATSRSWTPSCRPRRRPSGGGPTAAPGRSRPHARAHHDRLSPA